jgi:hypothetical protein
LAAEKVETLGAEASIISAQGARASIEAAASATSDHSTSTATHTRPEHPAQITIGTVDARTVPMVTAGTSKTPIMLTSPSDTTDLIGSPQSDDQQPDDSNLGLTNEDAPLWGSIPSGHKAQKDPKARRLKRRTKARGKKCNPKTNR